MWSRTIWSPNFSAFCPSRRFLSDRAGLAYIFARTHTGQKLFLGECVIKCSTDNAAAFKCAAE